MKRYRIELLQTAEGINLKKDKTHDIIVVFLWAENLRKAKEAAKKISEALVIVTHVGNVECIIKSVKDCTPTKKCIRIKNENWDEDVLGY